MSLEGLAEMVQAAAALQSTIREPRWRMEDRDWRTEDRSWRDEDRGWRKEDLLWRTQELAFVCASATSIPPLAYRHPRRDASMLNACAAITSTRLRT